MCKNCLGHAVFITTEHKENFFLVGMIVVFIAVTVKAKKPPSSKTAMPTPSVVLGTAANPL